MTTSLLQNRSDAAESIAPFAVMGSLFMFTILIASAMDAYPGGTAWDAHTHGHDFWRNYLCDLLRAVAINGESNASGARLAKAAMLSLAAGAAPFWWTIARFLRGAPLGILVRVSGSVSSLAIVLVAVLTSDQFPSMHPVLLGGGGITGLLAAAVCIISLVRSEPLVAIIGTATFAVCFVDLALYATTLRPGAAEPVAVAVLERVTLISALLWMAIVAWRSYARRNAA